MQIGISRPEFLVICRACKEKQLISHGSELDAIGWMKEHKEQNDREIGEILGNPHTVFILSETRYSEYTI